MRKPLQGARLKVLELQFDNLKFNGMLFQAAAPRYLNNISSATSHSDIFDSLVVLLNLGTVT